jgi:hypothetical protein
VEPTPTPTPTITASLFNMVDTSFNSNYTPLQYVITILFYLVCIAVTTDMAVFVFYKLFNFIEHLFDNVEKPGWMDRTFVRK